MIDAIKQITGTLVLMLMLSGVSHAGSVGMGRLADITFEQGDPGKLKAVFGYDINWTPAEITTLSLWLDADDSDTVTIVDGGVSAWADKSGDDNDFTQTTASKRPSYTAEEYVSFGTNDLLTHSVNGDILTATNGSVIVVAKGSSNVRNTDLSMFYNRRIWSATSYQGVYITSGGYVGFQAVTATGYHSAEKADWGAEWNIVHAYNDGGDAGITVGITNTATTTIGVSSGFADGVFALGWHYQDNVAYYFGGYSTGYIREVIASKTKFTTDELQSLEGYLAWKWDMTASLPADHPYKTKAPQKE